MYDTVNLGITADRLPDTDLLAMIPQHLTNVKESYCPQTKQFSISGKYNNYQVKVSERELFLAGSLCKSFYGNNFQSLDIKTTKQAIESLSDGLHISLLNANVRRLDVGINIPTEYPVPYYFDSFGKAKYYERLQHQNGIEYRMKLRGILIYDKIREMILKKEAIDENILMKNVLRFELRFLKNITRQFSMKEITANNLCDKLFYDNCLCRWSDSYFKINKNNLLNFEPGTFDNMKEFEMQIFLSGINALGGKAVVLQMIDQANRQGQFQNKMQVTRMKGKVNKASKTPLLTIESKAISELDSKIIEAVKNYKS